MVSFRSANDVRRSVLLRLYAVVLALLGLSQLVLSPAAGQHLTFSARSLTPTRTISSATKNKKQQANKTQIIPGKGRSSVTFVSAPCDVTIAPGSSPAGGYLALSGFGI